MEQIERAEKLLHEWPDRIVAEAKKLIPSDEERFDWTQAFTVYRNGVENFIAKWKEEKRASPSPLLGDAASTEKAASGFEKLLREEYYRCYNGQADTDEDWESTKETYPWVFDALKRAAHE